MTRDDTDRDDFLFNLQDICQIDRPEAESRYREAISFLLALLYFEKGKFPNQLKYCAFRMIQLTGRNIKWKARLHYKVVSAQGGRLTAQEKAELKDFRQLPWYVIQCAAREIAKRPSLLKEVHK